MSNCRPLVLGDLPPKQRIEILDSTMLCVISFFFNLIKLIDALLALTRILLHAFGLIGDDRTKMF